MTKLNIGDDYNYNDTDKLFMIYNDLDKYMKHLKRPREYKTSFKNKIRGSG